MNKEEPSLYMNIKDCHFLVDSNIGDPTDLEPRYVEDKKNWTLILSLPFLNAQKSSQFFRAFYVPWFGDYFINFGEVQLLRSNKIKIQ
jgi:alpha-1,2-mannosyltransferase